MRALGIHQGLAPVLDVVRDLRWGRVEETIGEDPLPGRHDRQPRTCAAWSPPASSPPSSTSSATPPPGPGATSRRCRSGRRELADVLLPPFEMALRAGARSVMNSYTDLDGVPTAADHGLLTDLLRGTLGFTGTVVSDYFAVAFLQTLHGVAGDSGEAAGLALDGRDRRRAADGQLLRRAAARRGRCRRASTRRWSTGRCSGCCGRRSELGLLDPDWSPGAARAWRRRHRPSTTPSPARWPGGSPSAPSSCWPTTAPCRWPRGQPRRRRRARAPTSRARCSAATRSPCTSACTTRTCRSGVDVPRCSTHCADPLVRRHVRRGCPVLGGDGRGDRRGGRGGPGRRRLRRRARRPGRAVRPRHLRRGLRRRRPAAARPAGGAARGAARHRHAGRPGAARRPARTSCPGRSTGWPPWCAASSPARRARGDRRGADGRVNPSGRLPVSFPGAGADAAGDLPGAAARRGAARSAASTRRRCSRSATACPTRR